MLRSSPHYGPTAPLTASGRRDGTLRAMLGRRPSIVVLLVGLLAASIVAGCGDHTPSVAPTASGTSPSPSASPVTSPSPSASPSPSPSPSPLALSERPFTVLVLGGDTGFRTDAVMVVGVDPLKKTVAMASIPRDTINVPLPDGGTFTNQKINAFYDFAAKNKARYPQGPGRATADMVGALLGIHIDYYAATTFDGFKRLTQAMGGVTVTLPKPVVDPYYQVTSTQTGVRFPSGTQTLVGERALIFVRTRQGDNDFERQRRQQLFLLAAGRQLLAKPSLAVALAAAAGNLVTDFPLDQVPTLIRTVASVGAKSVKQVVLGPRTWESNASCPCGYALQPNLTAMRATARQFFPWAVAP